MRQEWPPPDHEDGHREIEQQRISLINAKSSTPCIFLASYKSTGVCTVVEREANFQTNAYASKSTILQQ
jgi:hypothetical protein